VKTEQFDYYLPPSLIAQTPIEPRHNSRLLVYNRAEDSISENAFRNIKEYLTPGDLLVINRTKVIPARVFGNKETGGKVEVLLLKKMDNLRWEILVRGKNISKGKKINFQKHLIGEIVEELSRSRRVIQFSTEIEPFLRIIGEMPLPPYIHKKLKDQSRYQTVYAHEEGSAAAPTAGLHFTHELISALKDFGIHFAEIILHVGLDTFEPVTEDEIEDHVIHTEWCQITKSVIDKINHTHSISKRVVAVGTTTMRTLETADRFRDPSGNLVAFSGPTDLFIYPGYKFKLVDAMITNFHLPKSTLLMLVSAFAGFDNIMKCYQYAVKEKYRFYSFGDVMLIS